MGIGKKVAIGTIFVVGNSYLTSFINVIKAIILARILAPEDFGIVALALFFVELIFKLTDFNFNAGLIYKQTNLKKAASTHFFTNFVVGLIVVIITLLVTPLIGKFYETNILKIILISISMKFINLLNGTPYVIFLKKFEVKKLKVAEFFISLVTFFFSIGLALLGFGFWTLVLGEIPAVFIFGILLWYWIRWKPSIKDWDWNILKEFINFGKFILLAGLLAFLATKINEFLIGTFLTLAMLGFYSKAKNLLNYATLAIEPLFSNIMMPLFSKFQKNKTKLAQIYELVMGLLFAIFGLLTCLIFINSTDIVIIVLGKKWVPMAPFLKILIFFVLFNLFANSAYLFFGLGKTKLKLKIDLIQFAATLVITPFALYYYQAEGLAFALVIVTIISSIFYLKSVKSQIPISIKKIIFSPGIAILLILYFFSFFDLFEKWNIFLRLALKLILIFVLYNILIILFEKDIIAKMKFLINLIRKKKH